MDMDTYNIPPVKPVLSPSSPVKHLSIIMPRTPSSRARLHYSKGTQEDCIGFIEMRCLEYPHESFLQTLHVCREEYLVGVRTLRRWWNHYLVWGEMPYESRRRLRQYRKLCKKYATTERYHMIEENVKMIVVLILILIHVNDEL